MKRCILNVAVGAWYPAGQDRLVNSLKQFNFQGDVLLWKNQYPPGSPDHATLPYGFKSYAMQHALEKGYETLLWLDASCWAIQPLESLFDHIESVGHVFSAENPNGIGWTAGQWLKDAALSKLGITRDEALKIELLGGMFMGVNTRHERSKAWLNAFIDICQDGHTLVGPLRNVNGSVSSDPRCLGHVADQAVASVIAHRLGMALTQPPVWRDWYKSVPDNRTVIAARGM